MKEFREISHQYREASLSRDDSRMTDGELLRNFALHDDHDAFQALIQAHGPAVFGVCRRILKNHHDAEDALQATFLVLARSALSIQNRNSIAAWLYGVAIKTALKVKQRRRHQLIQDQATARSNIVDVSEQDVWTELEPILDQEIADLPTRYRDVIVLCDLEGRSYKQAAQKTGTSERAISMRLLRARKLLAKKITRRGIVLTTSSMILLFSEKVTEAAIPVTTQISISNAATALASGVAISQVTVTSEIAAIAEGVYRSMLITKLKTVLILFLVGSTLTLGAGGLLVLAAQAEPPKVANAEKAEQPVPKKVETKAKTANPRIKELRQQRLVLLEKVRESAKKLYQNARIEFEPVLSAERELLTARLEYSDEQQERIKACDESLKHAEEFLELAKERKAAARGTEMTVLKAESLMIEIQILRESIEAGE
jgi:RNA polymerase sigma factor (sigma-70 family)